MGVEHPPLDEAVARQAAEFYRREVFAITWTQSRNGDKVSKRVAGKGWQQTGPLEDVEDFVKRAAYSNPCINLRGSRLIGIEIDGLEQLERFRALGIPEAGMRAQSSTPERLHFFYDWPREIADNEPVSFRFEGDTVTAVTNNAYVCWPGTHPAGERKWLSFERTALTEEQYQRLCEVARAATRSRRKHVQDGTPVQEGERHDYLISETGRLRALGLSQADALATLVGLDALNCVEPIGDGEELRAMVADIYAKDPLPQIVRETASVAWDGNLAAALEDLRRYYRRYVVVSELQADAVALWAAHTFVYDEFRVTPYLNFWSPEPGSAKTLSLEILEPVVRAGFVVDDLTGAVLFRFVDETKPTLFFDEVDGVFKKKNDAGAEDIRKVLNSGYRQGKRVLRMGGRNNTEVQFFDPFCPKALAGLHDLPPTLQHRSIPIALKPPLPTDAYEDDYDMEEVEEQAGRIRARLQAWAKTQPPLKDKQRKPKRLPELDARRNEIWRPLLRIADLAGGRWPQAAREAALALSSGEVAEDEKSYGVRLLADIQKVVTGERVLIADVADGVNGLDESPWGGFNDGKGITTRELGRRLKPYGIRAKKLRIGERTANGYERRQFEDAFRRYLPTETGTTGTTRSQTQKPADLEPEQTADVPVTKTPTSPYEQRDVPVVPVSGAREGPNGRNPSFGDSGYLDYVAGVHRDGFITTGEALELEQLHKLILRGRLA